MSPEVIFPGSGDWIGPTTTVTRLNATLQDLGPRGGCLPPPGRDVYVLSADTPIVALSFNGTGITLYGASVGTAAVIFDVDSAPTISSTLPPASSGLATCDSVLAEAHGLDDGRHVLQALLRTSTPGRLYIYNATVDSETPRGGGQDVPPNDYSDPIHFLIGCIAIFVVGIALPVAWVRWQRRKQLAAIFLLPYVSRAADAFAPTVDNNKIHFSDKVLPPIPPVAPAGQHHVEGPGTSTAVSALERAVERAGFSVPEIVMVMERIHHEGENEVDADSPPQYAPGI
ncbi:hypothetical protein EXIGLDRAFT_775095 [Exidia glandulosa HHB12029]|uniref:Uncharacterized protein n=1 Tax=Exidia glandulosa HHB12029 TaxID=1314781 RepID=A0A165E247_EXIGL|nr:hypothetical protein EXIGLDRAFT_775095 [Exidia glandulosa HHB12029]